MDGAESNVKSQTKIETYSEHNQDVWLIQNVFNGKRDGLYCEAGALDGLLHSNTLLLEQHYGWRGLLIEANPFLLGSIKKNRPGCEVASCALGAKLGTAEFEVFQGGIFGWSGMTETFDERRKEMFDAQVSPGHRRKITVQTRRLEAVMYEHGLHELDLLCLDVEGAEWDVLFQFPFERFPIGTICVEDNYGSDLNVVRLLIEKGYTHLARVGQDEIWRKF